MKYVKSTKHKETSKDTTSAYHDVRNRMNHCVLESFISLEEEKEKVITYCRCF